MIEELGYEIVCPIYPILYPEPMQGDVLKHETHDQSTHGSWAGTNQITSEQKKAVQAYTQKIGDVTQWRTVAQNIRDGKPSDAPPEFVSSVKTLLNAIDEHSVTPTNAGGKVLLRSGVNWKGKLPVVGEIMSNPVASATWRHNVAEKFASSGDGKPVIIKYGSNTKGLDTSKFGAYLFGDEGEFIVSGRFEVVNRDKENGFTYVSVRPVSDVSKHQQHDQSTHGSWAGNKNSTEGAFSSGLTEKEVVAMAEYIQDGYYSTNQWLRKGDFLPPGDRKTLQRSQPKKIELLDSVFEKVTPSQNEQVVYRGVSGELAIKLGAAEVGSTFTDKGYVSTSGMREIAQDFVTVGNQTSATAVLSISIPKGTKVVSVPKVFKSNPRAALELERILPRGTQFEIVGKNEGVIELKVVPNE